MEVVLTDEYVIHNIVESIPKVSKNDAETPYKVKMRDGKHSLAMTGKDLKFGEKAYIHFNTRKKSKSIFIALAFLLAAILYLIFFRDVLKTKVNGG